MEKLNCPYMMYVTVIGATAPRREVNNNLLQGCIIAPTVFNHYFSLVVKENGGDEISLELMVYKYWGKLIG